MIFIIFLDEFVISLTQNLIHFLVAGKVGPIFSLKMFFHFLKHLYVLQEKRLKYFNIDLLWLLVDFSYYFIVRVLLLFRKDGKIIFSYVDAWLFLLLEGIYGINLMRIYHRFHPLGFDDDLLRMRFEIFCWIYHLYYIFQNLILFPEQYQM